MAFEAADHYIKIFTTLSANPYVVQGRLKDIELKLSPNNFCRVHRSYIVGICHIRQIYADRIQVGTMTVALAKSFAAGLYQRFILIGVFQAQAHTADSEE